MSTAIELQSPIVGQVYGFRYPDWLGGSMHRLMRATKIREQWHGLTLVEGIDFQGGNKNAWYWEHMQDVETFDHLPIEPQRAYMITSAGRSRLVYVYGIFKLDDAGYRLTGACNRRTVAIDLEDITAIRPATALTRVK